MSSLGVKHLGQYLPKEGFYAYNRSGAQRKKGDVLMTDLAGSASETTSVEQGLEGSVFANLVLPTTAGVDAGFGCHVLDSELCDDNALGYWISYGYVDLSVKDDDAAAVAVDRGDNVTVLNGAHDCDAVATGDPKMGIALADAAASGSVGDASTIRAIWWGGRHGAGLPTSA